MLDGPISVGDCLVWEPDKAHARAVIKVAEIKPPNADGEIWIRTSTQLGTPPLDAIGFGDDECWNDEDRIREACVRGVNVRLRITRLRRDLTEAGSSFIAREPIETRIAWWERAGDLLAPA